MAGNRSILIVEDDAALRETLAEQLADDHDFSVATAAELDAANKIINDEGRPFDAVILDIGMPDGDGCHFCSRVRRQGRQLPIIILTGSDSEADVIRGLEAGANDYVVKPFRMNELLARLRAQLRLFETSEDAFFFVGSYKFSPSKRVLQDPAENRRIRLTATEVAILRFLYRADNRAVDRQLLLHEVWGHNPAVTTHTLETHVYRLRQKMEHDPKHPALLVTESGGYRLQANIGDPIKDDVDEARRKTFASYCIGNLSIQRMTAIVVIAASAGGLEPLLRIITALPASCSASVLIVMHIGRRKSMLPNLLQREGKLPAVFAEDKQAIEPGHIYVAPADCHMLVERNRIRLDGGPKVRYTRPAADPLFVSAATAYGERVIGIVLSGGDGDGAVGLQAIKAHGGTALVQRPEEATIPSMPLAAIAADHPDNSLPAHEIAQRVRAICS